MKPARALRVALPALAVFLAVLIARFPARWAVSAVGGELRCARVAGSLWSGSCGGATVAGASLGQLTWRLHPLDLLQGELAAHLLSGSADASAEADVAVRPGGTLVARHLVADLPLDPSELPALPPYVSGSAQIDLERIEVTRSGVIRAIQGRIILRNLIDSSGAVTPLGSFVVEFPATPDTDGPPVGRLHDLGGPLSLDGTLRLTRQPGYELQVSVAARADAVPSLLTALRYLGAPDANGRRQFALSGTY